MGSACYVSVLLLLQGISPLQQLLQYSGNLHLPSSGVCQCAPSLKENAPSHMQLVFTLNVGLASSLLPLALVVTISGSATLSPCSLRSQCNKSPLRQAAPKGPASTRGLLTGGTMAGLCPAMACFKARYMASMAPSNTVAAKYADASCMALQLVSNRIAYDCFRV